MKSKTLILALFLLVLKTSSQIKLINTGTSTNLIPVSNINGSIIVGGGQSFLSGSIDECDNLNPLVVPGQSGFWNSYQRLNSSLIFCLSQDDINYDFRIYKSTNGGQAWSKVFDSIGGSTLFSRFAFFNNNEGIVIGTNLSNTQFARTVNGGTTWLPSGLKPFPVCTAIRVFGDSMVAVGGNYGGGNHVVVSKDRGHNWITPLGCFNYDSNGSIRDIYFLNKDTLFVVGTNSQSRITKSFDGGKNWICTPIPLIDPYGVQFKNVNEGYVIGKSYATSTGIILKTTNQGANWEVFDTQLNCALLDMDFLNDSIALFSGTNGVLFKLNFKKVVFTGIKSYEENLFNLVTYPNPVHDKLKIESKTAIDKLSITNTLGQLIFEMDSELQTHEVDASTFPKGIYYLNLTSESRQSTLKFIKE